MWKISLTDKKKVQKTFECDEKISWRKLDEKMGAKKSRNKRTTNKVGL